MNRHNQSYGGAFVALITPRSDILVVRSRRETGELELPGGRVEADEDLWTAAKRETAEEAGIAVQASDIIGRANLLSRKSEQTTGLFVVKLSLASYQAVDIDFTSDETLGLANMGLNDFSRLPTHDEALEDVDGAEAGFCRTVTSTTAAAMTISIDRSRDRLFIGTSF
jgi:8-oxo-dGTP pyrophosphatase MutT (NUDIX family)